ncbi:MAG: 5'/3'-nucleotidase SurE [Psychrilyobacter sp.]|nr:5'/3'-nucleotidase SurE [Psychrilyobacter sp.]
MNILISNDDGIYAEGIKVLVNYLRNDGHKTFVVAPLEEQSGTGHGITLHQPLRVQEVFRESEQFGYSVSGKPADTIKVALTYLYDESNIDFVISGINRGANLGTDLFYSGTFAAAAEGTLFKKNAIALSLIVDGDYLYFESAGEFIVDYLKSIQGKVFPIGTLLNINVPNLSIGDIKGIKYTRQSNRKFKENLVERNDTQGNRYFWLGGSPVIGDHVDNSDAQAIEDGYISITPVKLDLYDNELELLLKK